MVVQRKSQYKSGKIWRKFWEKGLTQPKIEFLKIHKKPFSSSMTLRINMLECLLLKNPHVKDVRNKLECCLSFQAFPAKSVRPGWI
jgi:hypothetical protein